MAVLVTGGSGFIGSHVVDKLVEKGYAVRVLDIQKTHREEVEWVEGTVLDEDLLLRACKDIETVYHLAAIADVNVALTRPKLCIPPPDHRYTKTKIGQEHLVIAWYGQSGLPYTILRYGIPYGPRMRANMAIATFVSRAMHKETIQIFGDGCQGRCFTQIEDMANGSLAALKVAAENQILNIASSEFVTRNQIVEALKEHFPDLLTRQLPERPQDFRGNVVSIEKAKKTIKWVPKISFKKGLESYIEHVKCGST